MHGEIGFACRSRKSSDIPDWIEEVKTSGLLNACRIVFKPGNHLVDEVSNLIIVFHECVPVDVPPCSFSVCEGGLGQVSHNVHFTFDVGRDGLELPL